MSNKADILSVDELLRKEPSIPDYQRPYKWTTKNVGDLLSDIRNAIEKQKMHPGLKYRIGTVILHQNGATLNIVDGQQRYVSLLLLKKLTDEKYAFPAGLKFKDAVSKRNIYDNYHYMKKIVVSDTLKKSVKNAFEKILETVVITVAEEAEAFRLFDSQNARGKALYPHDLLKAYHLREIKGDFDDVSDAVKNWESRRAQDISELFEKYLFAVLKWKQKEKKEPFTAEKIDFFKGISADSPYTYAQKALKASPVFQIGEPFVSGRDFFDMVECYLKAVARIRKKAYEIVCKLNGDVQSVLNEKTGLDYAKTLFECAVLCYYDKFHDFDENVLRILFVWAFMLRVDMERLSFASVNKYAVGEENGNYTNAYSVFALINQARLPHEIALIPLSTETNAKTEKWRALHSILKELNGDGQ